MVSHSTILVAADQSIGAQRHTGELEVRHATETGGAQRGDGDARVGGGHQEDRGARTGVGWHQERIGHRAVATWAGPVSLPGAAGFGKPSLHRTVTHVAGERDRGPCCWRPRARPTRCSSADPNFARAPGPNRRLQIGDGCQLTAQCLESTATCSSTVVPAAQCPVPRRTDVGVDQLGPQLAVETVSAESSSRWCSLVHTDSVMVRTRPPRSSEASVVVKSMGILLINDSRGQPERHHADDVALICSFRRRTSGSGRTGASARRGRAAARRASRDAAWPPCPAPPSAAGRPGGQFGARPWPPRRRPATAPDSVEASSQLMSLEHPALACTRARLSWTHSESIRRLPCTSWCSVPIREPR